MAFSEGWMRVLSSAYYPLLLSGSSLIVCFWAELFHLRNVRCDKPQFLSKSLFGFALFNVITYSLLLAEFIIAQINTETDHVSDPELELVINKLNVEYNIIIIYSFAELLHTHFQRMLRHTPFHCCYIFLNIRRRSVFQGKSFFFL